MATQVTDESAKNQIHDFVMKTIEEREFVRVHELNETVLDYLESHPLLKERLIREVLEGMVQRTVAEMRKTKKDVIVTSAGLTTSKDAVRRAAKAHNVFGDWMERVEEVGKHVRLKERPTTHLLGISANRRLAL